MNTELPTKLSHNKEAYKRSKQIQVIRNTVLVTVGDQTLEQVAQRDYGVSTRAGI